MLDASSAILPVEIDRQAPLRGRDIICFSHDWNGDPLSKTHLMRLLARENRVLWVNSIGYRAPTATRADVGRAFRKLTQAACPIREVEPNLFVLSPLAIPAYGRASIRALNRTLIRAQVLRAMRRLGFRKVVNWVFNPAASVIAGALGEDVLIYHCVDEYTAFSGVDPKALGILEDDLLARADLVLVSADSLVEAKARHGRRPALVRHGVDHDHFCKALDPRTRIPEAVARLPRPILGFFGLIADWVDVDLLERVADHFPGGSVVTLGRATTDVEALASRPNVHMLGRVPYAELPAYSKGFDVALMPFRLNELTLHANPLKVREYLAAGLPVVSTAIPEVEVLGLCRIAYDHDDFLESIQAALAESPGPRHERSAAIAHESWAARLDEIRGHLASLERQDETRARRCMA